MPTRLIRITLLIALLTCAVFIAQPTRSAEACSRGGCGVPETCSNFYLLSHAYPANSGFGTNYSLVAGQVITITATSQVVGHHDSFTLTNYSLDYAGPISTPGTLTYIVPTTGIYPMSIFNPHTSDGTIDVIASCVTPSDPSSIAFNDGRVNKFAADTNQTATIYCTDNGGLEIYGFYQGQSYLAMQVSKAEIAAVPEQPAHNTLIKTAHGISLYRLTSGNLQVNAPPLEAGKGDYTFIWDGC